MRAHFIKRSPRAKDIYSFEFSLGRSPKFLAGQYVELTIKHPDHDDRGEKRWFSISSSPTDKYLSITTKYTPVTGASSFKHALYNLKPDALVDISDAMGDFVLPVDKTIPLLFVAGGIGITPILSILGDQLASNENRKLSLIYAVKDKLELIDISNYKSRLSDYLEIVTGDGSSKGAGPSLSSSLILEQSKKLDHPLIYLSGPEKMVEIIGNELVSKGIRSDHLVSDFFDGYDN